MDAKDIPTYTGKDDRLMVLIPAGSFIFGPDQQENQTETFYIDRFPVTNVDYKEFVEATGHAEPSHWRRGVWPEGKADHPVVNVNWESAAAFAKWAGKRLPAEIEWEKAARGIDGRRWPWGNEFDSNKCNTSESGIFDTTPVGKYSPAGDSPFGASDMAGNVWEWIGGKLSPLRMPLRGGNWLDGLVEAQTFSRRMHTPRRKNDFVGFRCVVDKLPE
jgi:formylglycine-generating enzyme required for sulfatase activity